MNLKSTLAALAVSALALPAEAALFDLTFDTNGATPGGVFEAVIDGTLQMDGNTVVVNAVLDFATFDGVPGPSRPFIESYDVFFRRGTKPSGSCANVGRFVCRHHSCRFQFGG